MVFNSQGPPYLDASSRLPNKHVALDVREALGRSRHVLPKTWHVPLLPLLPRSSKKSLEVLINSSRRSHTPQAQPPSTIHPPMGDGGATSIRANVQPPTPAPPPFAPPPPGSRAPSVSSSATETRPTSWPRETRRRSRPPVLQEVGGQALHLLGDTCPIGY